MTRAYHPQSNGLTENWNGTLQSGMKKKLNDLQDKSPDQWDTLIAGVLLARRTTANRATKTTPFELVYGFRALMPSDFNWNVNLPQEPVSYNNSVPTTTLYQIPTTDEQEDEWVLEREDLLEKVADARRQAYDNIIVEQSKQKAAFDAKTSAKRAKRRETYFVGESVWKENCKDKDRRGGKFNAKRDGPWKIVKVCLLYKYLIGVGVGKSLVQTWRIQIGCEWP